MYVVRTNENTTYVGIVQDESPEFVTLYNQKLMQTYEIRKSTVTSSRLFSDKKVIDTGMSLNGHANRYMIGSSAIVYDKPVVSINYEWMLFDNTDISLDENWDLSINSIFFYPSSIGLKSAYQVGDNTFVGGTAFVVLNFNVKVIPWIVLGYGGIGRITKGNENVNVTLSGGVIGVNNQVMHIPRKEVYSNLPFAALAYQNRFHEKWALSAEGFYFPQTKMGLGGGGFKFMRSKETAWSFGCYTIIGLEVNTFSISKKMLLIPYVGYTSNMFRK
jgi:hypothetical protein